MYLLKYFFLTLVQLAKQAWLFPQTAAAGYRHWRGRAARVELEAERLDRIRHPSKYLGKS